MDREIIDFSTDVLWHCESSKDSNLANKCNADVVLYFAGGYFGAHPANEYCFTLSDANVVFSVGYNSR